MNKKYLQTWTIPFIWIFTLVLLSSCKTSTSSVTHTQGKNTHWQTNLIGSFRIHYHGAVEKHRQFIRAKSPVIIQNLSEMTLKLPTGEAVKYKMDNTTYIPLAHLSHVPLTIYSILYMSDFQINDSSFSKLQNYLDVIHQAEEGLKRFDSFNEGQKKRNLSLLAKSDSFLMKVISNKKVDKESTDRFVKSTRTWVEDNLTDAAADQLNQFRQQLKVWRDSLPKENWGDLSVVILGPHQPRKHYLPSLFFKWLLNETGVEKKVIYAEYQFPFFGENGHKANQTKAEELAYILLTKVDLERDLALVFLGDEEALQQDILGPFAEKILKKWGDSKWPLGN